MRRDLARDAFHLGLGVRFLARSDQLVLLRVVGFPDVEVLPGVRVGLDLRLTLTRRTDQKPDQKSSEDNCWFSRCTRHCSLSFPVDATGSPGRMPPGGSISSRTIMPCVTCWTTMRSTRFGSIRL